MRFKGLDLNLLVVLDAMLTERNVTRAAERLNLSQSATSSALARLRDYFRDELLVQTGRTFKLTPRAEELLPAVKELLSDIDRKIITMSEFDPTAAERSVKIMASDYVAIVALRRGLEIISRVAPKLTFEIAPVNSTPHAALERYDIDLLIAPRSFASDLHPYVDYFDDDYVCLADAANPVVDRPLTPEEYLALPHAIIRFPGSGAQAFDDLYLEQQGFKKNVTLVAPSHATLPLYVVGTNRIVTLQRKLAEEAARTLPARLFPVPIAIPRIEEILQWHWLNDGEPTLKWVGITICEIQEGTFRESDWMTYPLPRDVLERAAQRIVPQRAVQGTSGGRPISSRASAAVAGS